MEAFEQRKWDEMSLAEAEGHAVIPVQKKVDVLAALGELQRAGLLGFRFKRRTQRKAT